MSQSTGITELNFKLSKPLTVTVDGSLEETHELRLTAPSMKDRKEAGKLQQMIARAQMSFVSQFTNSQLEDIKKQEENKPQEEVDDKKGDAIKAMILGSNEDLEVFYKAFDTLALRVCTVYDGVKLKEAHINEMVKSDYENMCFEYIGNFIE